MSSKFFMLDGSDKRTLCDIFDVYSDEIGQFCAGDIINNQEYRDKCRKLCESLIRILDVFEIEDQP